MCLEYAKVKVNEIFKKNIKEITCWKIICQHKNRGRYFPLIYSSHPFTLGKINISNRRHKKINRIDDYNFGPFVYKGFHVFLNKTDAIFFSEFNEYVVPVKCRKEDYVAHNRNQAVFMAIEFPKRINKKEFIKKNGKRYE